MRFPAHGEKKTGAKYEQVESIFSLLSVAVFFGELENGKSFTDYRDAAAL